MPLSMVEQTPCPRSKLATGSLQSPPNSMNSPILYRAESPILEDSWKRESQQGMNTGSSSLRLRRKPLLQEFKECSQEELTTSQLEAELQEDTASKKTLELEDHLNLENIPSEETVQLIGTQYEKQLREVEWIQYPVTSSFDIIVRSESSLATMLNLLPVQERSYVIMEPLVRVKVVGRGKKQEFLLMSRIRVANSGAGIAVSRMLLLTSFAEVLTSVISSGGQIGILSLWRPKEVPLPYVRRIFGLRAICTQSRGILTWMSKRKTHSCEDCMLWRSHHHYWNAK